MKRTKSEPYGYRPPYLKAMDLEHDQSWVCTPALHTGFLATDGPPPEDRRLQRLIKQFQAGKIQCHRVTVAMFWIRPYSDFRPYISDKYREYIHAMKYFGDNYYKGPIPIVLYEHKGQLIMSADYKTYWYHRMNESWTLDALILGDFTQRDFCRSFSEPFTVSSLDLNVEDKLMDSKTRRLALLLRGEPVRIETREEREAINRKDFQDAMREPVPYEPEWAPTMNQHGEDPHFVYTPALHEGHFFGPPPEDKRYTELAIRAQAGKLDCQLASVALAMIRPYSDYKPVISDELRTEFEARYEEGDDIPLTVYEYEPGHFMVGSSEENYALYTLLREQQLLSATCIILGSYTKTWAVGAIDKPFNITLSPQAGFNPDKTAERIGKRIYTAMREKDMRLEALARLTGIDFNELHKIVDEDCPTPPTLDQVERIARVLSIRAADILPF